MVNHSIVRCDGGVEQFTLSHYQLYPCVPIIAFVIVMSGYWQFMVNGGLSDEAVTHQNNYLHSYMVIHFTLTEVLNWFATKDR